MTISLLPGNNTTPGKREHKQRRGHAVNNLWRSWGRPSQVATCKQGKVLLLGFYPRVENCLIYKAAFDDNEAKKKSNACIRNGRQLVSEHTRLLKRLANPRCRRQLWHICVCSALREPIFGLCCAYVERILFTVCGRERINGRG